MRGDLFTPVDTTFLFHKVLALLIIVWYPIALKNIIESATRYAPCQTNLQVQ